MPEANPSPRPRRSGSSLLRIGLVLALVGAVAVVGGIAWNARLAGDVVDDVVPTPLGQPVSFTAEQSFKALVFTSEAQDPTAPEPTCRVTDPGGEELALDDPFQDLSTDDLDASATFDVTKGTSYEVVCGDAGQPGSFGVSELPGNVVPSITTLTGGLLVAVGAVLAVLGFVRRSRERRPAAATSR